jgi:hypothetical protein
MANPTCAPFTDDPLYANRAGSTDEEMLASVIEQARKDARGDYNNTDKANAERMARYLKNMTGMQMTGVEAYVSSALKAIGKDVDDPFVAPKRMQVIAAAEVYWERRGAGIQQMAKNFLAQKQDGQLAAAQALEFLYQLKSFNRLGQRVAGENLSAGSALRQKRIMKGTGDNMEFTGGLSSRAEFSPDMNPQILDNVTQNIDAFDDIAKRINSGDLAGALQDVEKVAKQISMVDDPRDVAGMVSRWKSSWNTWDEVWINGLLSSPATFVVNTVGAAWVVMRPLLQSGFAQAFAASGLGGPQWTKAANAAAAEAGAQLAAMQASFQDAAILGWRAAKSEKSLLMGTDQKITAKNMRENGALFMDRLGPSAEIDRAIDLVGQIVRLPSRGMLGMDEMAKTIALRGEVAANGVRRAVLDGVDPTDQKALKRYVEAEMEMAFDVNAGQMAQRYAFDPSTADDAGQRAYQYQLNNAATTGTGRDVAMRARESVFQEENRIAKGINKGINSSGPFRAVLKPFIPFVTTPTNILKQGLYESTGLDAAGKTFNIAKANGFNPVKTFNEIQTQLLNDPADTFRIGGQVAFMTLVGGTVYGMAMNGTITGGGPEQWATGAQARKAQQAWVAAGNIPYSIDVGNGVRIPLAKLGEPFATPLRMIADLGMYSGYMDRTEQDKNFAQIIGIMSAGVFEASFLQGLDNLMTIVRAGAEKGGDGVDYEFGRGVQNYVATQMPFGSLLAFADRVNNPYRAAYEGATFSEMLNFAEIEMGRGVFGKLVNKIPGVETQPMLIDQITGQPVPIVPGTGPQGMNPLLQAVPFFPRQSSADPVWDAIYAIQGTYTEKGLGDDIKATTEEQQTFNRLMSETRIDGKTVAQAISEFRRRPDVIEYLAKSGVTLKNSGIKREFNALLTRYRNRARNLMFANSPNLAQRRNTAAAINYAQNTNDVERAKALESQMDELVLRAKQGY